jgi:hypothetical protein
MSQRIDVDLSGLVDLMQKVKDVSNDIDKAMEKGAEKVYRATHSDVQSDMASHTNAGPNFNFGPNAATGKTVKSLVKKDIKIKGDRLEMPLGFKVRQGGLASIFLMYGVPRHAPNPGYVKRDKKLYNEFYGNDARNRNTNFFQKELEDLLRKELG